MTVTNDDVFTPALRVGDVVSFSYERNPKTDMPYNPKIVRIRTDLVWEDVIQSSHNDKRLGITNSISPLPKMCLTILKLVGLRPTCMKVTRNYKKSGIISKSPPSPFLKKPNRYAKTVRMS
jgi:hypothetical protein